MPYILAQPSDICHVRRCASLKRAFGKMPRTTMCPRYSRGGEGAGRVRRRTAEWIPSDPMPVAPYASTALVIAAYASSVPHWSKQHTLAQYRTGHSSIR
eukprot:3808550-Rhodomonas_salina.1